MKKLLTLLLLFISCSLHAQFYWAESFEAPYDMNRGQFFIDTVDYHHNIWQIGGPHKHVFNSAYSAPNVIITDTLHPYPPSDTSVFIVSQRYAFSMVMFSMNFMYKLDIDSGVVAKMELSGDSGRNWINPITEDTAYQFYWGFYKPRLDTSELTWQSYQLNMNVWANAYPGGPDTFPHYRTSDTILFRFTFISLPDTTGKDGWVMDNFYIENAIMEGAVHQVLNNDMVSIYPVPSAGNIYIQSTDPNPEKATVSVYDVRGHEMYRSENVYAPVYLNLPLANGSYVLKYSTPESYAIKRLEILR